MEMLVNEIIKGFGPNTKRSNCLVAVNAFAGIVDDLLLYQFDHAVIEHFSVDTQITMVVQTV